MGKAARYGVVFVAGMYTELAFAAVDTSSDAYRMGGTVAKVFGVVFALLIIKKIFFTK